MNERECTLEDAREALQFVSPEDRDTWVEMAFAIRSEFGDLGFDIWDDWSQGGSTYKAGDSRAVWRSAKAAGSTGSVRIGTLFKRAIDNGFKFKPRTEEDRRRHQAEADQRRQAREKEEAAERARLEKVQSAIATMSRELWDNHLAAAGRSAYLGEKGVDPFGVRFGRQGVIAWFRPDDARWDLVTGSAAITEFYAENKQYDRDENPAPYSFRHIKAGTLAIPLVDGAGALWALQLIYPSGKKSFFKDARKRGLFHQLAAPPAPSYTGRLWIAEGYSSAASVHMAVQEPTAMAIDAGNLVPVARTLRELYPQAEMVIAADNDVETEGNPGVGKAREAAQAVNGRVWVPQWPEAA